MIGRRRVAAGNKKHDGKAGSVMSTMVRWGGRPERPAVWDPAAGLGARRRVRTLSVAEPAARRKGRARRGEGWRSFLVGGIFGLVVLAGGAALAADEDPAGAPPVSASASAVLG